MKLSSGTQYGLRAILELAQEYGKAPVRIATIAAQKDISIKYLEQLISMLKNAGLVRSLRGPSGGYFPAKPPAEISLKDVVLALEGPTIPGDCHEHSRHSKGCADCITSKIWQDVQSAIEGTLESVTLADLLKPKRKRRTA